ncbi:hypothetical protein [Marinicella gelatinilytica]|uniref:hypothetical protein n=1 Tax=Marinicella gelatinilytica TaxID=2996017 RepID=UPI002260E89B|nr:hypothetical protein [Marinicella gelatinilytica]MCX7544344.1 hypothetical protein [Marinicella gelatinilytica]
MTTAIEVPPGRYYQTNGLYHLDMTGTTQLVLPIKKGLENMSALDTLVINNLDSNQAVNLYLTAQLTNRDTQTPFAYKQKLINNQLSINELDYGWQTAAKISDVALVVESEISFGFGDNFDNRISWQSIQLTHHGLINQTQKVYTGLSTFVPLSFSSINFYSNDFVNIYKAFLMWLGIWLAINFVIFIVIKPAPIHFIVGIILAWFMVTIVFAHNFTLQGQFNQNRFAQHNNHLNHMDEKLYDMAQLIDQTITEQNNHSSDIKIFILGGESFNNKRLKYHLLQYNVGVIGRYEDVLKTLNRDNSYAALLPPFNSICEPQEPSQETPTLNILVQTTQFCLLQ